ncbi:NAD(P)H-quinone oxidoreductase subunit 2, chloroplastic [Dyadobacter sp. CECT 9623]|uniref:NADH-quinone oxidoreductase subunit N n=1 Tax=Dyadobacter linearis TaxID=2823330 RepID=A0ABN7RD03_9BACT|nr:NADH-quinone oxidoreductase subunit N [Dyadobacter sp. CECT 9623]CAG5073169.1 NAD(P)H-quinone oxidoreductase subunit 2, chloroplastic [Dyadobacter sp. CECT 9623]
MNISEQLIHIRQSLAGIVPEIFLALLFCFILLAELLFLKKLTPAKSAAYLQNIALAGCIITFGLVLMQWNAEPSFKFHPLLFLDRQAVFFKLMIVFAWLFTLLHVRFLKYDFPPEYNALLIAAVAGMNLLSMSTHLLSIYLSLELISISSYILVALSPYRKAAEGGIKYLLFGSASSAVMLYGISFIYGITGTMDITSEALTVGLSNNNDLVVTVTIVLTLAGLLFKLSLVPFHVWTPDVYESAPTPLVSFLSVAPKVAVVLVLMRLAGILPAQYFPILGGIALISMTIGNVAALWQTNARRLLAYSSISQAGYLLVGIAAYSRFGFESAVFYTASYLIINLGAFLLIDLLKPKSDTTLADYEGLGKRYIWISGTLTVIMIALAGLPPTVGFTSKLLIFSALWESYHQQEFPWMLWLLIGGILNAAISLAYYLRLPYLLFFKSEKAGTQAVSDNIPGKVLAGVVLVAVLALFFSPEWLLKWITAF